MQKRQPVSTCLLFMVILKPEAIISFGNYSSIAYN